MATSFATSQRHRQQRQRTRSRTTTSTATATATASATATAIVQNVLEIGLATVLERRGAFPPEFFVHQALLGGGAGGDEGTAARFDEDWLRSQGTCTSRSHRLGHDVNNAQRQSASQSQLSQSQSQSRATEDSGSSGGSSSSSSTTVGSISTQDRTRQSPSSGQTDHNDDHDDDHDDGTTETECDAPLSTVGINICTGAASGGGTEGQGSSVVSQLLPPSSHYRPHHRHHQRSSSSSSSSQQQSEWTREGTAGISTTMDSAGSMESSDEEGGDETRTVGGGSAISSNDHEDDHHDDESERERDRRSLERMRAEALLLLEWIRRGVVGGCWRRNLLSRVVVGVCVPSGNPANGNGEGGGGPARLVESYAFDLSTAADEVARLSQQQGSGMLGIGGGGGGRKKKNKQQQHQQLHSEEDVQAAVGQMLRGIRGYIDANYGSNDGHQHQHDAAAARESSSMMTQFTNFDELDDATATAPFYSCTAGSAGTAPSSGGAATTTRTTLPRDRYFTFRVEFTKPISKAQLPPALNDQSEEFGTVPALGRVLAGKDAVPNKSKSTDESDGDSEEDPAMQREPTADPKSLQRLGRWALGRVQPAHGVSVGFNAFCEDPDDVGSLMMEGDDSGSGGRNILADDDDDVVSAAKLGLRENADPQKIFAPLSGKAADIKPTEPSQESYQSAPSIAIGQSVLAYPHRGKNDKADAVDQALSCTVVDTRVHHVHGQQYKVEFDSSCGLEHLKQWMSAERIVVITSPICSSEGDEENKRREMGCGSDATTGGGFCRPRKRTRVVYRYITKPIRFEL